MPESTELILLLALGLLALVYALAKRRMRQTALLEGGTRPRTLPRYYGYCALWWTAIPMLFFFAAALWQAHRGRAEGVENLSVAPMLWGMLAAGVVAAVASVTLLRPGFHARQHIERWLKLLLQLCALFSISVTLLILASIVSESMRFFEKVPLGDFLFGLQWSPQSAAGGEIVDAFGAVPVFAGTILITLIAMGIAGPLGLLSAIYLSEYASGRVRGIMKPVLEILAGVPTVVYGYFAAVTFAPFLRDVGGALGLSVASESALAAGVIMGIMIIPFVLSLSDDVMKAVPGSLREASLGLGATPSETIRKVVFPAALPGVMGALLLAISRGIGETMIVVMAAGLAANLTLNPLESVTTVTAQIVTLLAGDQEFDSAKTLAAFALSLTLFVATLILNVIALVIVKKYREQYE